MMIVPIKAIYRRTRCQQWNEFRNGEEIELQKFDGKYVIETEGDEIVGLYYGNDYCGTQWLNIKELKPKDNNDVIIIDQRDYI